MTAGAVAALGRHAGHVVDLERYHDLGIVQLECMTCNRVIHVFSEKPHREDGYSVVIDPDEKATIH